MMRQSLARPAFRRAVSGAVLPRARTISTSALDPKKVLRANRAGHASTAAAGLHTTFTEQNEHSLHAAPGATSDEALPPACTPSQTAIVLIEYQNEFATPGGKLHDAVKVGLPEEHAFSRTSSLSTNDAPHHGSTVHAGCDGEVREACKRSEGVSMPVAANCSDQACHMKSPLPCLQTVGAFAAMALVPLQHWHAWE